MTTNHAEVIRECLSDGTVPICDALDALDALTREAATDKADADRLASMCERQGQELIRRQGFIDEGLERIAKLESEMRRYLPVIERAEQVPGLWGELTAGTGIATANGYRAALAPKEAQDLSKCPKCGGPADNGHDRCLPPSPYLCSKCQWPRAIPAP